MVGQYLWCEDALALHGSQNLVGLKTRGHGFINRGILLLANDFGGGEECLEIVLDGLLYSEVGLGADVVLAQPFLLSLKASVALQNLADGGSGGLREGHACVHYLAQFDVAREKLR